MKDINSEVVRKILIALYKYHVMTPWQLGILLNHRTGYVYNALAKMKDLIDQEKVKKISVPFIWPNAAAYHLDKLLAYWVSDTLKEEVKPVNWPEVPSSVIQTLTAHNFTCELILATKEEVDAGVIEWLGFRDVQEKYRELDEKDKKSYGLKLDGYGVLQLPNSPGQVIYNLDVFTGEETELVLEDKIVSYIRVLKNYWLEDTEKVCILLLCHSEIMVSRLSEIWESIADREPGVKPMIGIAYYKDIIDLGVLGDIWLIPGQEKQVNISHFAQQKLAKTTGTYIGKQQNMAFTKQGYLLRKAKAPSALVNEAAPHTTDQGLGFTAEDWTKSAKEDGNN